MVGREKKMTEGAQSIDKKANWVCPNCQMENEADSVSCKQCLRGRPQPAAERETEHLVVQSSVGIIIARLILLVLIVISFFLPWSTGWSEPRVMHAGFECVGIRHEGYCYYAISGWESFIFGFGIMIFPAIALIIAGLFSLWRRHRSRLYMIGLSVFLGVHLYIVGQELAYSLFGGESFFEPIEVYWGGLLCAVLTPVAMSIEILDWQRGRSKPPVKTPGLLNS